MVKRSPYGSGGKSAGTQLFLSLADLLAFYGRRSPGADAILAPGCTPMTYGELSARANNAVRALRSLALAEMTGSRLYSPNGAETAVVMVAIATAAVCVPLNPDLTTDELQRYFVDLRVAALVIRADMSSGIEASHTHSGYPSLISCPNLIKDRTRSTFHRLG